MLLLACGSSHKPEPTNARDPRSNAGALAGSLAANGGSGGSSATSTGRAGTAGAGRGGSGRSGAGGAGSESSGDGASGVAAGGGGAAATIECSGSIDAPTAPVVVAARITCSRSTDVLTIAAGAANSGWVAERAFDASSGKFTSFFFHVTESAVTVETLAADVIFPLVTSDSAGVPALATTKKNSLDWLSRPAGATSGWSATSAATTTDPSDQVGDLAIAADGTQYLTARLFGGSSETVQLETRSSGAANFTHTGVVTMLGQSALSVDASGGPHISYWSPGRGLFDWQPGGAATAAILSSTDASAMPRLHRSRASGGGPLAIAVSLADSVHVVRQRSDATFDDIKLADSAPTPYGLGSSFPCQATTCQTPVHQVGEYQRGVALAQTTDGSQWIVLVHDHIDRDISYTTLGGGQCMCGPKLEPQNDRSTSALVVQRLAPDSATPSAVLWKLDLGAPSPLGSMLDASAAGSLLHIVIDAALNQNPSLLHYLILDTALLH